MGWKRLSGRDALGSAVLQLIARRATILCVIVAMLAASCGSSGDFDEDSTLSAEISSEGSTPTVAPGTTASDRDMTLPSDDKAFVETSSIVSSVGLEATQPVLVFFGSGDPDVCAAVGPHERVIDGDADIVGGTFEQLVRGPGPIEVAAGASSFFSLETAGTVRGTGLNGGLLVVDFNDFRSVLTPAGANTSCGSGLLLAELNSTAFQFAAVDRVRYELEGSCDKFGEWLQTGCVEVTRTAWSTSVSELLPGEAVEGPLPIRGPLAVIGVGADDVLNVRVRPGVDEDIVQTLGPLTTGLGMTGRARLLSNPTAIWLEIETSETIGWVHSRFVAPLAGTYDITAEIRTANDGIPTGSTIEEIGQQVIAIRGGGSDPQPVVIVVAGPTAGDPSEITYDLTGFYDDSVRGERLHIFIREANDGTQRLELQAAEVTYICIRGSGGGTGLCP